MFKKLIGVNIFPIALILTFFSPITRSFKSHAKFCKVGNPNYHCSQSSEIETLSDIQAQIEAMIAGEKNDKTSVPVEEIKPQSYNNKNGDNKLIAAGSAILGSLLFAYQQTQPVSGVALLNAMQKDSADLGQAICSKKPTVVDFYAPWCESCKVMAPSMRALEKQYGEQVNFVVIDGSDPRNYGLVNRFQVDGIPHLAFLDRDAEVKTSLIGAVPSELVATDLNALIKSEPLPVEGYDPFGTGSHFPLQDVSKSCAI